MAKQKTIEEEINAFLEVWDGAQLVSFLRSIIPLFELYDVEDEDDWVAKEVGEEFEANIRLIRTVYLLAKIADLHTGKLAIAKAQFKGLWQRMEKEGIKRLEDGQEDKETSERHEETCEGRGVPIKSGQEE